MSSATPRVTIAVPFHNSEMTLAAAIRSIQAQTYENWTLLLIDDGSRDASVQIARSFHDARISVLSDGAHRGLPARLNESIGLAHGEYYARMDSDDVAYPRRLERQLRYLQLHPELDLIGAWVVVFDPLGVPLGKRTGPEAHAQICARPLEGFSMVHPSWVGRLAWFRRFLYRDEAVLNEDQDLLMRAHPVSTFGNVPEILLGYREGRRSVRKVLRARYSMARSAWREYRERERGRFPLGAVLGQALKSAIDLAAITSGLNHRILRHRARPITRAERDAWQQVWDQVGDTAPSESGGAPRRSRSTQSLVRE